MRCVCVVNADVPQNVDRIVVIEEAARLGYIPQKSDSRAAQLSCLRDELSESRKLLFFQMKNKDDRTFPLTDQERQQYLPIESTYYRE